jgi:hypothetical protein
MSRWLYSRHFVHDFKYTPRTATDHLCSVGFMQNKVEYPIFTRIWPKLKRKLRKTFHPTRYSTPKVHWSCEEEDILIA